MPNILEQIYMKSMKSNIHTTKFGLIRSLLAFSSLVIVLVNPNEILFHGGYGVETIPNCGMSWFSKINFFCLTSQFNYLPKILASLILISVISGYFVKITGILHWWIAFSINSGLIVVDGGSQVAAILTLLLLPLCFTDNRKNHWASPIDSKHESINIFNYITFFVLKIQVSFIYFDAAVSKISNSSWTEGSALFYFINDPLTGASGLRLRILNSIFNYPILLVLSTYSVILLELALALSIFIDNKKLKLLLFKVGIIFHILIFLTFGIFTFVIAMFAALFILLYPYQNISFHKVKKFNHVSKPLDSIT